MLPPNASEASQKRYAIALRLADTCPSELGSELALTGSTSSGMADDDSDLELNLWAEQIPPVEARVAWFQAAGVEDTQVFAQPRPDESYWIGGRFGNVPLEMGWQTFAVCEANIQKLLAGKTDQTMAYILLKAIPFRTQGRLALWQEQLRVYSDVVQAQAVQNAVQRWSKPDHLAQLLRLARRGERLAYTEDVLTDLNVMITLLYAINRRWKPSRKWMLLAARELAMMPANWSEQIDDVLSAPPEESVPMLVELLLDALALVPSHYDVSGAMEALKAGLGR